MHVSSRSLPVEGAVHGHHHVLHLVRRASLRGWEDSFKVQICIQSSIRMRTRRETRTLKTWVITVCIREHEMVFLANRVPKMTCQGDRSIDNDYDHALSS